MNRDRVGALFAQALDLPEAQRADWLAEQCAGDEATRAEVERLLRADAKAHDFIERSPGLIAQAGSGFELQAKLAPLKRSLEGGGFAVDAVVAPAGACGVDDLIFRDGFDPRMLASPAGG